MTCSSLASKSGILLKNKMLRMIGQGLLWYQNCRYKIKSEMGERISLELLIKIHFIECNLLKKARKEALKWNVSMNGSLRIEILFPCEPNLRLKPVIRSNLFPRLRLVVIGVSGSSRSCSQSGGVVKVSGFQFWPILKDAESSPPKKKIKKCSSVRWRAKQIELYFTWPGKTNGL